MDSSRVLVVLGCVDLLDVGYVRFWCYRVLLLFSPLKCCFYSYFEIRIMYTSLMYC